MKTVYTCFTTDVLHEGHMNIIKEAKKYGRLIAGVMSDEALVKFDRFPTISFEMRKQMLEGIAEIDEIVDQKSVSYRENLLKYRPDYVVHGDNWKDNEQKSVREEVI